MLKKILSASALSLLVPITASAVGVSAIIDGKTVVFTDVQQTAWFAASVREAAELGIVSGYRDAYGNPSGKFGPSNNITLAESLKIVSEAAGYNEVEYASKVTSGVSHWSAPYVSVAKAEGFAVITSTPNLDRPATRAEVSALITSAFRKDLKDVQASNSRYTDVNDRTEYSTSIELLSRDKIVAGDTDIEGQALHTFRPNAQINRAEVAKMIIAVRAAYGTPGTDRKPEEQSSAQATENLVVYGQNGFSPSVLRVKKGETVTFRNDLVTKMWVAVDPHPNHTDLPGFDATKGLLQGQTYVHTFTKVGTFGYHNHLNASMKGTIIVED